MSLNIWYNMTEATEYAVCMAELSFKLIVFLPAKLFLSMLSLNLEVLWTTLRVSLSRDPYVHDVKLGRSSMDTHDRHTNNSPKQQHLN
jgi:hypothetical protein